MARFGRCLAFGGSQRGAEGTAKFELLPLAFELEATSLTDACDKFPDAVKVAIEQAIEEAREMRREAAEKIYDLLIEGAPNEEAARTIGRSSPFAPTREGRFRSP